MSAPSFRVLAELSSNSRLVDISSDVQSADWEYGLQNALTFTPFVGQCRLKLLNKNRQYSPLNSTSPYYGNFTPGKRVEIWIQTAANGGFPEAFTRKFTGWIDTIDPSNNPKVDPTVDVGCNDTVAVMQNAVISLPVQTSKTADQILGALLGSAFGAPANSAPLTFISNPTAGLTITVTYGASSIIFTYVAAAPATNQILVGATATASAFNFYSAFNNLEGLATLYGSNFPIPGLIATYDLATKVTIANQAPGALGNYFTVTTSNAAVVSYPTYGPAGGGDWPKTRLNELMKFDLGSIERFYDFGEAIGATVAVDSSGNGANATYTGNYFLGAPADYASDGDTAVGFNGTLGGVSLPLSTSMALKKFTLEFWLYAATMTKAQQVLYAYETALTTAFNGMRVVSVNDGSLYVDYLGGNVVTTPINKILFNQWNHVVINVGYSGAGNGSTDIYINGALAASSSTIGKLLIASTVEWAGRETTVGTVIEGRLDKMGFYTNNLNLTAGMIANHYAEADMQVFDAGVQTLPRVGSSWGRDAKALQAAEEVCRNEFGHFHVRGNGKVVFRNQTFPMRHLIDTNVVVANNTLELNSGLNRSMTYNLIRTHGAGTAALASGVVAKSDQVIKVPGNGSLKIELPFIDSNTGQNCTVSSLVLPLVAGTDWVANEKADGTGVDYATGVPGYIKFLYEPTATRIKLTIINNASGALFFTTLKIRGVGLVIYNPVTAENSDTASIKTHGKRGLDLDLSQNTNAEYVTSLSSYLLSKYKTPQFAIDRINFAPVTQFGDKWYGGNAPIQPATAPPAFIAWEPEQLISITDNWLGITAQLHQILSLHYGLDVQAGTLAFDCAVERLDTVTYWILGDPVYGVLGTTTRLAI